MDEFLSAIGKALLRIIGQVFVEILFDFVCYWVGWPICKIMTLGEYPGSKRSANDHWCSAVGLVTLAILLLQFGNQFS